MRCSRYRPISQGATGRPPIYPAGFQPKEFNQRDLPYGHHTRSQSRKDETSPAPGCPALSDRSGGYALCERGRYAAQPQCDPRSNAAMLQSPLSKHGPLSRTSCRGADACGTRVIMNRSRARMSSRTRREGLLCAPSHRARALRLQKRVARSEDVTPEEPTRPSR
jgi:hypothetical protein